MRLRSTFVLISTIKTYEEPVIIFLNCLTYSELKCGLPYQSKLVQTFLILYYTVVLFYYKISIQNIFPCKFQCVYRVSVRPWTNFRFPPSNTSHDSVPLIKSCFNVTQLSSIIWQNYFNIHMIVKISPNLLVISTLIRNLIQRIS